MFGDGGYPAITVDTKKKDKFLRSLGINCNLAPVADVSYSRYDFIYRRAPSNSVRRASKIVRRIVKQMSRDKVVSCVANPVVVDMEATWKEASRSAVQKEG